MARLADSDEEFTTEFRQQDGPPLDRSKIPGGISAWAEYFAHMATASCVMTIGEARARFGEVIHEDWLLMDRRGAVPSSGIFGRMMKRWSKHPGRVLDRVYMVVFQRGVAAYSPNNGNDDHIRGLMGLLQVSTHTVVRRFCMSGVWESTLHTCLEVHTRVPRFPGHTAFGAARILAICHAGTAGAPRDNHAELATWADVLTRSSTGFEGELSDLQHPARLLPRPPRGVPPVRTAEADKAIASSSMSTALKSHFYDWRVNEADLVAVLELGEDAGRCTQTGQTGLHVAARHGHMRHAARLLNLGVPAHSWDHRGDSPLHLASASGNAHMVALLLRHNADPNVGDGSGHTPLMHACRRGFTDVVDALLAGGADPQCFTLHHPLVSAAANSRLSVVERLLAAGCHPEAGSANGSSTALHAACTADAAEVVECLLQAGSSNRSAKEVSGSWPLHNAAIAGSQRTVALILARSNAEIDEVDQFGETALMCACKRQRRATAELLLACGANPLIQNAFRQRAADLTTDPDLKAIVTRFAEARIAGEVVSVAPAAQQPPSMKDVIRAISDGNECMVLHAAATGVLSRDVMGDLFDVEGSMAGSPRLCLLEYALRSGRVSIVKILVSQGASVNQPLAQGMPPLHAALEQRRWSIAECLLASGADATGDEKLCPLLYCDSAPESLLDSLLAGGARLNPSFKDPPLCIAVTKGDVAFACWLLSKGANPSALSSSGDAALHRALRSSNTVMLRALLQAGCESDVRRQDGCTPLHIAVTLGALHHVRVLLAAGADPQARNGHDAAPIHFTVNARANRNELVRMLAEAGADMNALNGSKKSATHLAVMTLPFEATHVEYCTELLNSGVDVDAGTSSQCGTALCLLASTPNAARLEYMRFLVARRANVDAPDSHGVAPIHQAVRASELRVEVATLLLDAGANANALDSRGLTPLRMSLESTHIDNAPVIRLLLDKGADVNLGLPLHWVLHNAHKLWEEYATLLVQRGCDVNATDGGGRTPLGVALLRGSKVTSFVPALLGAGAAPSTPDSSGRCSLHYAFANHDDANGTRLLQLLLEAGADPNTGRNTNAGSVLLEVCARFKPSSPLFARKLIEHGADVHAMRGTYTPAEVSLLGVTAQVTVHVQKEPALCDAVRAGSRELVEVLLGAGADPTVIVVPCDTLLHTAAGLQTADVLELLLERIPEALNAPGFWRRTPLHIACAAGSGPTVRKLLEVGARVDVVDVGGALARSQCKDALVAAEFDDIIGTREEL